MRPGLLGLTPDKNLRHELSETGRRAMFLTLKKIKKALDEKSGYMIVSPSPP